MRIGIVGLPNVGKSTLFNALTKQAAKAQNVPFTTIEPNIGVVAVPDERLDTLAVISKSEKIVPTTIEFVDIAGLVKKAHQGEGLGNQFLANIREVDAIIQVVRTFTDEKITHVEGSPDPIRDLEIIETELALADLATLEKILGRVRDQAKGQNKEAMIQLPFLENIHQHLAAGKPARAILDPPPTKEEEISILHNLQLLSAKPMLIITNVGEDQILAPPLALPDNHTSDILPLCVKIEQEIVELDGAEQQTYLAEYGLKETGLDRLIKASYKLLSLATFFTSGPMETRAWTVTAGSTAPVAAGKIHTDMQRGFIRAETVAYDDLIAAGSYAAARSAGKVRDEGKEYIVRDGDIMLFKFSA